MTDYVSGITWTGGIATIDASWSAIHNNTCVLSCLLQHDMDNLRIILIKTNKQRAGRQVYIVFKSIRHQLEYMLYVRTHSEKIGLHCSVQHWDNINLTFVPAITFYVLAGIYLSKAASQIVLYQRDHLGCGRCRLLYVVRTGWY